MGSLGRGSRARMAGVVLAGSVIAVALGIACGPPPSAADATAEAAPYPFTVLQIRAGCAPGRTIEYRVEAPGEAARTERWSFAEADPETAKITTTTFDTDGKQVGPPVVETAKWTELHEHAHFPQAATTIDVEPITLPAGTFETMRYVVTKGDVVKTYWFARSLPGPPVRLEVSKGGKTVMLMTMEANLSKPASALPP
jgi:hypothetical protein